ncbi:MAG: tRNA uridine-5-carboxymethylaminomethyl(34) synthesis GTPase MnmE [Deltaproteobacteria bacterium]|nr:tRNA uridine-5-carboxymethylaminomethyl(34) synthesis GTPase MnmE [Deltaproteobacteria bacterium]MBW2070870.1 tRNA uridine-5-carboxymethylaminomethyl(34) synthesis GTPase MnmE [Deltaproteobacteria bacterium]
MIPAAAAVNMRALKTPEDTIAAIATPIGTAGIGIIRLSGPQAWAVGQRLFRPRKDRQHLSSHQLYLGHIICPETGKAVDEVLVSFMKAPHTYTREDVVEINCHSGLVVLERILHLILSHGARLAEPGEFSRRAFLNGRIDLTQAEAIADLINAKTHKSLELAGEQLQGRMHQLIARIRGDLLDLLAYVEAAIDFPEDDVEYLNQTDFTERLRSRVYEPVKQLLQRYEDGRILREGLSVIITGKPNVGKSSLLNNLLNSERALVTPIPGTTRDLIEEGCSLRGIPLRLVDTAGLHPSEHPVERLGIERARERLSRADLVLFLLDRSQQLTKEDAHIYQEISSKPRLLIVNKVDLPPHPDFSELTKHFPGERFLQVSALRGDGVEELKDAILETIIGERLDTETSLVAPNLRHKKCLESTLEALARSLNLLESNGAPELLAVELQESLAHLGDIIGQTTSEDVLDQIFNQFCIGK